MHQRPAGVPGIVQPNPFDTKAVEHPAPPEPQQVGVIGLAGLVAGDIFA
jgi:hypothetical protein